MPALTSVLARSVAPVKSSATLPSKIATALVSYGLIGLPPTAWRGQDRRNGKQKLGARRCARLATGALLLPVRRPGLAEERQRLDPRHPSAHARSDQAMHIEVRLLLVQTQAERQMRIGSKVRRRRFLAGQIVARGDVFPAPQFF